MKKIIFRVEENIDDDYFTRQTLFEDDVEIANVIDLWDCPKDALDIQVGGNHYKDLKIQPIEYVVQNKLGYLEGNMIKYVTRHEKKNGFEDIEKAIHYLELIKKYKYRK